MSFLKEIIIHVSQPANFLDAIFSIGTIVLSVVAIIISIITFRSQKKHNKNSVRPILNIVFGDYENDIYIRVDNYGVGPAIIKGVECTYCTENGKVAKKSVVELIPSWILTQKNPECFSERMCYFTDFVKDITGKTIAPEHGIVLIKQKNPDPDKAMALRNFLKDISIKVFYTDIYDSKPWPCERSCDFFGRTLYTETEASD